MMVTQTAYLKQFEDGTSMFFQEDIVECALANIVIVSPFGKTTHDNYLITHYFTSNGFNVFRFDPRNHAGLSSGVMENFTLPQLDVDLCIAFDTFNLNKKLPTIILSISLSFPPSLKYCVENQWIKGLLGLVPAVNPEYTSKQVVKCDFDSYRGNPNIEPYYQYPFGCKLKAAQYIHGLDMGGYSDFDGMVRLIGELSIPIYFVSTDKDEYVDIRDVYALKNNFGHVLSEVVVLSDLTHEVGRSLSAARKAVNLMVKKSLCICGMTGENVNIPKLTEIISGSSRESTYLNTFNLAVV